LCQSGFERLVANPPPQSIVENCTKAVRPALLELDGFRVSTALEPNDLQLLNIRESIIILHAHEIEIPCSVMRSSAA
jgi:hypothetical protein